MSEIQCFKIKQGTKYDQEVKEYFLLLPRWKKVFKEVGELLGEEITRMGLRPNELWVDLDEIKKEENKKLFTKDGCLKKRIKRAEKVRDEYRRIIKETGLENFEELGLISFKYGVYRLAGQYMQKFYTSDGIYFKTDFDLTKRTKMVEPISEIEYEEKYLEELKKRKKENERVG